MEGASQQAQAVVVSVALTPTVISRQAWASTLNSSMRTPHSSRSVSFARPVHLVVLQTASTSVLQAERTVVRLVSWAAPALVVLPEQERADVSPPPAEISFWLTDSNSPFLLFLLLLVASCFTILLLCFSKLAIMSFHIFIARMAPSKQVSETTRPVLLDPDPM